MTKIPARRPIFVGCEGGSERSYVAFLKGLADDAGRHVHLQTENLGGGDARSALAKAVVEFRKYRSRAGPKTSGYVLLDTDRTGGQQHALEAAAQHAGLRIIWQNPCHEALLLRHFAGQDHMQPHDCVAAMNQLRRHWPTYQKNTSASQIARVLDLFHVRRAAGVTPALQSLLDDINL